MADASGLPEGEDQRSAAIDRGDQRDDRRSRSCGWCESEVKITADTNVLLRAVVGDDEVQQQMAIETLESAELVAISAHSLCEFAWVLDRGYKTARSDIASVISHVIEMHNVVVNRPAIEAGLPNETKVSPPSQLPS